MTITDVPMLRRIEEALARNPGKRRRRINSPHPSEHALRESGFSEHDVKILVEGAEHEARWRQEQVGSSDVSSHALVPPTGWVQTSTPGAFSHEAHGTLHVSPGKWVRRDKAGTIRGSGTTQESMTAHLRTADAGTQPAATEALGEILGRIRGESPRPTPDAARLMEAIRNREVGRTATSASGEDLNAKMRNLVTR